MKEKFLQQAKREYSPQARIQALMLEGVFFLGILPGALIYFSSLLDQKLELPRIAFGAANVIFGCGFIMLGLAFAWWAGYVQFTVGRGTPVPLMATQQLIVQGPYAYCRNPMALGAIVIYTGEAILLGSISALGLVLAGGAVLLGYIKLLEEKEMELRFGEAYRDYRTRTPFILPRFWRRK